MTIWRIDSPLQTPGMHASRKNLKHPTSVIFIYFQMYVEGWGGVGLGLSVVVKYLFVT